MRPLDRQLCDSKNLILTVKKCCSHYSAGGVSCSVVDFLPPVTCKPHIKMCSRKREYLHEHRRQIVFRNSESSLFLKVSLAPFLHWVPQHKCGESLSLNLGGRTTLTCPVNKGASRCTPSAKTARVQQQQKSITIMDRGQTDASVRTAEFCRMKINRH